MTDLRTLAANAAKEIRENPEGANPHVLALANHFNHTIVTQVITDSSKRFKPEYWERIARAMDERPATGELDFWISGIGGEISLLAVPGQHEASRDHLVRKVLKFCDAVDIVG